MNPSPLIRFASLLIAAVAVTLLLRAPDTESPDAAADAIRAAYGTYKEAVLANDGNAAAAVLSAGTIAWYGTIQQQSLHASKEEVQHLPLLDRVQVLAFRQRVPANELHSMTPRQLVAYAIQHGWVGKGSTLRSEIGNVTVTVSGRLGSGDLVQQGKPTGQQYSFVKENGQWHFDQLPLLKGGSADIARAAQQRGIDADQLVLTMLGGPAGKPVSPDIWNPPFPSDTAQ